jgi:hypothetical protein
MNLDLGTRILNHLLREKLVAMTQSGDNLLASLKARSLTTLVVYNFLRL